MRETLGGGTSSNYNRTKRVLRKLKYERLLRENTTKVTDCRCWTVDAQCYVTKKFLFGKKCTKVVVTINGIGSPTVKRTFYFDPKQYTLWLLRK